ncbi:16S rRNA (guanine(527)-N(7))-methyltransferase RsmG [Paenibacillus daejeonensis]|uniref:16S rRNA (guanine(527)-N(7))-methyltransferase RsmG n=1 Tax=Paenibacillus daejeonensis TaxID=135193 RepID=UPI000374FDA9|nr:16S rRNA (guanine(527)-N(7))-methyltransferase RsmG [Paenibacillus daejeonensis]
MNNDSFAALLAAKGLTVDDRQLEQFNRYFQLLVEWNERMNLTGITERDAVYEKHFYDSVALSFVTDMSATSSLADIGSGAGFPSLPLKICFPHLKVTIVDSLNKRIQFLQHVAAELGLEGVTCVHGRAEDIARQKEHRDRYDLVTARAVARLAALNELCLPFARTGGLFAAMKGTDPAEELEEAGRSLRELKGKVRRIVPMQLPLEQSERHVILIDKLAATPRAYPRKAGTPVKQPLL